MIHKIIHDRNLTIKYNLLQNLQKRLTNLIYMRNLLFAHSYYLLSCSSYNNYNSRLRSLLSKLALYSKCNEKMTVSVHQYYPKIVYRNKKSLSGKYTKPEPVRQFTAIKQYNNIACLSGFTVDQNARLLCCSSKENMVFIFLNYEDIFGKMANISTSFTQIDDNIQEVINNEVLKIHTINKFITNNIIHLEQSIAFVKTHVSPGL